MPPLSPFQLDGINGTKLQGLLQVTLGSLLLGTAKKGTAGNCGRNRHSQAMSLLGGTPPPLRPLAFPQAGVLRSPGWSCQLY